MYLNDLCHKLVIGHVPLSFVQASTVTLFNINCKVTGKRVEKGAGYAWDILVVCTCARLEKAVAWIQKRISEEIKITENIKIKCLK